jgi:hypothetical protein
MMFSYAAHAGGGSQVHLLHLGDGLPFEYKEIVQRLQQAKCLRNADQRFQRALTVAFEFAQRPSDSPAICASSRCVSDWASRCSQTNTQRVQDLSGSREMKSHFYDP